MSRSPLRRLSEGTKTYVLNIETRILSCRDSVTGITYYPEGAEEARIRKAFGRRLRAALARAERDAALRDLGLTKVRGARGGTYWE
jgi:hypothetical protein